MKTVLEGYNLAMEVAKTGRSLKEVGGKQRGNPLKGGDTPLSTAFEHSPTEIAFGIGNLASSLVSGAIYHFTSNPSWGFWNSWGAAETLRHARFFGQLQDMADSQGCKCKF